MGTLVVFGGLGGITIPYARGTELSVFLLGANMIWVQIITGTIFGIVTAMAGWQIINLPIMTNTKDFFIGLLKPINLTNIQIIFISVCAGVGEELLFRGSIQPFLGVWMTSILFVLLHGYLNPFNLPLTYYGIYMVLVIAVMGFMTEHIGILSAIIAHVIIDIILLFKIASFRKEIE